MVGKIKLKKKSSTIKAKCRTISTSSEFKKAIDSYESLDIPKNPYHISIDLDIIIRKYISLFQNNPKKRHFLYKKLIKISKYLSMTKEEFIALTIYIDEYMNKKTEIKNLKTIFYMGLYLKGKYNNIYSDIIKKYKEVNDDFLIWYENNKTYDIDIISLNKRYEQLNENKQGIISYNNYDFKKLVDKILEVPNKSRKKNNTKPILEPNRFEYNNGLDPVGIIYDDDSNDNIEQGQNQTKSSYNNNTYSSSFTSSPLDYSSFKNFSINTCSFYTTYNQYYEESNVKYNTKFK